MRAQKRDGNEVAIIEALDRAGFPAQRAYPPADYDLLVEMPDSPLLLPMECKMPGGRVTEGQAEYFELFPDLIVFSPAQAVKAAIKYSAILKVWR